MVAFSTSTGYISLVRDATLWLTGLICAPLINREFHWTPNGAADPTADASGYSRPVSVTGPRPGATVWSRPPSAARSRRAASLSQESGHRRHGRVIECCDTSGESAVCAWHRVMLHRGRRVLALSVARLPG